MMSKGKNLGTYRGFYFATRRNCGGTALLAQRRSQLSSGSPCGGFRSGATSYVLPKTASTAMVETLLVVLDAMITGEGEVIQEMTAAGGALTP
jgi:hypothetical protein